MNNIFAKKKNAERDKPMYSNIKFESQRSRKKKTIAKEENVGTIGHMELDELEILDGDSTFFIESMNYIDFFWVQKLFAARTNPTQNKIRNWNQSCIGEEVRIARDRGERKLLVRRIPEIGSHFFPTPAISGKCVVSRRSLLISQVSSTFSVICQIFVLMIYQIATFYLNYY